MFSQPGNDSKWFLTKIIFQNRYLALETGLDPPPFMANAILNFHFDYLNPSLRYNYLGYKTLTRKQGSISIIVVSTISPPNTLPIVVARWQNAIVYIFSKPKFFPPTPMAGHGPPPVVWDFLQWSFRFRVWYCLVDLAELLLIRSNFVQMFISIANEVFSVS